jgi:hypothetical protein
MDDPERRNDLLMCSPAFSWFIFGKPVAAKWEVPPKLRQQAH